MILAHYALFYRTAAEKNFEPPPWIDSGLRGAHEHDVTAKWQSSPRDRSWQETEIRLVPIDDIGAEGNVALDAAEGFDNQFFPTATADALPRCEICVAPDGAHAALCPNGRAQRRVIDSANGPEIGAAFVSSADNKGFARSRPLSPLLIPRAATLKALAAMVRK